jgi:uncharacterized membrane protein
MFLSFHKPLFLSLVLLVPIIWAMMHRYFRGPWGRHKILVGCLRSLLIVVLAMAIADPRLLTLSDQVNLYFCLDVSESIGNEQQIAAQEYIKKTTAHMGPDDQAGLIVFGRHPSVEISLRNEFYPDHLRSDVNAGATNIYAALRLAAGKLPEKGRNKIVLFSDGNENLESSMDMAYLARSLGIELYPVTLASWFGDSEVYLKEIYSPPNVALETPFEISVVIIGPAGDHGELVLFKNDRLFAKQPAGLQGGENIFRFADMLTEPGLYRYSAVINFHGDVFFQNNEGLSFTKASSKSRILLVTANKSRSDPLSRALNMQGLDITLKSAADIPGSIRELLDYHTIILDNVSGRSMPFATMENMETYVKDIGGGLIMVGGDQSFGAGYYSKTPMERALPVYMAPPTELLFSDICLIFVIDKSSSMAGSYSGQTKLDMAKIAAFSSIELLNPTDSIGIVTFDSDYSWIVPITRADRRQEIADRLSRVREEGGTDLYPALKDVLKILKGVASNKKHVIVLSDGQTEEADFESLVQAMRDADISVSTVAIGSGSHIALMQSIAEWGQGRSYFTEDPEDIPNIFAGETKIATKKVITEKVIHPRLKTHGEMMQGIDDDFPAIYGQVVTYPKPGAAVFVQTGQGPLLAGWRYGLGRSAAFTSDLGQRWGRDWVLWDHYGRFVSQLVKWVQRKETQKNFSADIERAHGMATLTVDVTTDEKRFVNYLELKGTLLYPSGKRQTIAMDQTAPGRYKFSFPAEEIGEYYISLSEQEDSQTGLPHVFGLGIAHSDEFNTPGVNKSLLEQLAAVTGGRVLSIDEIPRDLFDAGSGTRGPGTALWPYLVLLFLLLLVGDVIARKLNIEHPTSN